jgi:hypothetical protein
MDLSDTAIMIRLIKDRSNELCDDNITIRKNLTTGDYDVKYTDTNGGSPLAYKTTDLYRVRVMEYVYMLFKNLSLDEDGYVAIQVDLPSMPRVLVSGDKFKDVYYRDHFYELIGTGLDLLETSTKVSSEKKATRPHM